MTWFENHGDGHKAKFVPCDEPPAVVWPARGFHNDSGGGYGTDCVTNSRYDVLARDNPSWAEAVLSAAIAAKMPLLARRVGSAGKYHFWLLCASSPAEAQEQSLRLKAEHDAAEEAAQIAGLRRYYALPADHRVVTADGRILVADAARISGWRGWQGWCDLLIAGRIVRPEIGTAVHDSNGHEVAVVRGCAPAPCKWLPSAEYAGDPAPHAWWEAELDRLDRLEAERQTRVEVERQTQIEAARAAKRAPKPAKPSIADATPASPFAILANLRTK